MKTYSCAIIKKAYSNAVIINEDIYTEYLFINTTQADIEEMILAFSEEDLDNYIQEYQELEYEGQAGRGPNFWIGKSRGQALLYVSFNYPNITYLNGIEL